MTMACPSLARRPSQSAKPVRCAIYTRKSTEDGLEQEFNSLDAQYEACVAYALSQQHEGWELVDERYDDPGFSGGNMERPGLKQLLSDIEAGRIDIVLLYKIDRLTRSLSDFTRIVEVFEEAGASFVSITQSFNTTTSMGRLTLNMLLSFGQFEREIAAERIRDKIAASRRKGLWTGGPVPLGYDLQDRKLVINESEAQTVRLIFERHQEVKTLTALEEDLGKLGLRTKRRPCKDGRIMGDIPFRTGTLRALLANPIYLGKVRQGGKTYPGQHKAIVNKATWDASQRLLAKAKPRPRTGHISPLAGRIRDGEGRKLIAAHANKDNKRYRYYTSKTKNAAGAWRLPAGDIESLVRRELASLLGNEVRLAGALGTAQLNDATGEARSKLAGKLNKAIDLRELIEQIDAQIAVEDTQVTMTINRQALRKALGYDHVDAMFDEPFTLTIPAMLRKRGHELRFVEHGAPTTNANQDEGLVRLLKQGWEAWAALKREAGDLVPTERSELTRYARLRFLAPDIVSTILEGRQPVELTARRLMRTANLPISWQEQRQVLGFS